MPTQANVLGFATRWYPEAVRTATRVDLTPEITIRLISAPAFVATKLEAFATRGGEDFLVSHDLEDVLNIVEGRESLVEEISKALPKMRKAIQAAFSKLLGDSHFVENLEGLINEAELRDEVLDRLRAIAH